jgi:outer membrane protein
MLGAWLLLVLVDARVVTLAEAVRSAEKSQPRMLEARAAVEAAMAGADQARAPLLPQVKASGDYERTTVNRVWKRTGPATSSYLVPTTWDTIRFYDFGISANQLLWDFGQTYNRWRAAGARADAARDSARLAHLQVVTAVRAAFFTARARKALAQIARDTLDNQERHLGQIAGFVEVGTRPRIDLAQARADRANARVRVVEAENDSEMAKARLNQAMGVSGPTDYDVADESFPELQGEERRLEVLIDEAVKSYPALAALQSELRAEELTLRSLRGAYGPTLSIAAVLNDAGMELDNLRWNATGMVTLSWPLFQGLLTRSVVRGADAQLLGLRAQVEGLRQQVWLGVQQAALGLRAAKESLSAADEALVNAQERLQLAEGRYETGAGSIIELGDAQLGATTAAAQRVLSEYKQSAARAELAGALGRI